MTTCGLCGTGIDPNSISDEGQECKHELFSNWNLVQKLGYKVIGMNQAWKYTCNYVFSLNRKTIGFLDER